MNKKKKRTIMIVDDSIVAIKALKDLLQDKYDIFEIKDPVDCLKVLAATTPKIDLGLVDIEMPRMDGFKLIKMLKKHPLYTNVPFIMVSSNQGQKYIDKAVLAGAADYIVKPADKETLLQKIHKQLGDEEEHKDAEDHNNTEDPLSRWEFPE